METVWQRVRSKKHTVVVGSLGAAPADLASRVVRVDCGTTSSLLGPLLEARTRIEQLVQQQDRPILDSAAAQLRAGLRRRLLGEEPESQRGGAFIRAFNQLCLDGAGGLVLDGIQNADRATLQWLTDVLGERSWLKAPIVLVHQGAEPSGDVSELIEAVRRQCGVDSVVKSASSPADVDAAGDAGEAEPSPEQFDSLPAAALRVLRAAAMSGKVFDAAIVAALLDSDEFAVLEQLQTVRDAGLPIEDLGRGRFRIPQGAAQHLLGSILPSLAEAWHRRLAHLLGHVANKETEDEASVVSPAGSAQSRPAASRTRPASPTRQSHVEDPLRAARHASAVGDSDLAAEQYVAAARRAAEMGAPHDAFALAEQALELLDAVPGTESRRVLRIRALAARARIQWQAAGPSEQFSLPAALATADAAKALLTDQDPSDLRADLGALCGGICYDIGDKQALERALAELSGVSRELLAADDPIGAARLLNDEAAVWVRLGDVVRANYLLKKSREIFARLTPQNAVARQELAETDHMLARLILHVDARPGREEDAVRIGIEHALAAEEAYRDLSLPREQARVWETLGRLELLRGRGDAAIERLEASVRAQQRFGDVLGLARSAAALSDLLAAAGRSRDALALLGQSIAFNLDKGSPLGLAFNRAALEALAAKSPDGEPEQRAFLESLRKQVRAGEALLGRADLPEDARTNQDIRGNSG